MASRGKRSAGDRVLESKHVIGLFLLMLVFSGVFFTLGYVMGRNQYDGQVRAATNGMKTAETAVIPKSDASAGKGAEIAPSNTDSDPATANNSDWEFYGSNKPANSEPRLQPQPVVPAPVATAPAQKALSAKARVQPPAVSTPAPSSTKTNRNSMNAPLMPSGTFVIQVAALKRQDDALAIASTLQKKHFMATVLTPQKDKFYRVQVGPFKDQKSADAAKKGLESEGFKAFYVKH
jgi:cell division septation protein DedD